MHCVPCTHVAWHTCAQTQTHTDTHTHRLPGLCHSAAVAAAALRAPAHPQLLLRLTPIEVVCEFPKTRHLSALCSPPTPTLFLPSLPFDPLKKMSLVAFYKALFVLALCLLLPGFSGSASAVGPSLSVLPHPSCVQHLMCRRRDEPRSAFSLPLSPFDRPPLDVQHTHTHTHRLSQNSNVVTAFRSTQQEECPLIGEQTRRRRRTERERERGRASIFFWAGGRIWAAMMLASKPTPLFLSLCLCLLAHIVCVAPSLSLSLMHEFFHTTVRLSVRTHALRSKLESRWQRSSFVCASLSCSLSLSITHTHTHTHALIHKQLNINLKSTCPSNLNFPCLFVSMNVCVMYKDSSVLNSI